MALGAQAQSGSRQKRTQPLRPQRGAPIGARLMAGAALTAPRSPTRATRQTRHPALRRGRAGLAGKAQTARRTKMQPEKDELWECGGKKHMKKGATTQSGSPGTRRRGELETPQPRTADFRWTLDGRWTARAGGWAMPAPPCGAGALRSPRPEPLRTRERTWRACGAHMAGILTTRISERVAQGAGL